MKNWLRHLFVADSWGIALRPRSATLFEDKKAEYTAILFGKKRGYADPFLADDHGKTFLFCEMIDNKKAKAVIACAEIKNNLSVSMTPIIESDIHLSYPCVFQYEGIWYMVPETTGHKTIELLEATTFPFRWEKKGVLLSGGFFEDSTIFLARQQCFLMIYEKRSDFNRVLSWAEFDPVDSSLGERHEVVTYSTKNGRPGGSIFEYKGSTIRVVQPGVSRYGEKLSFFDLKIDYGKDSYSEKYITEITPENSKIGLFNGRVEGIHTYNFSDKYEVIDFAFSYFDLFHPVKFLFKKLHIFGFDLGDTKRKRIFKTDVCQID